jgi:hypothetical protein
MADEKGLETKVELKLDSGSAAEVREALGEVFEKAAEKAEEAFDEAAEKAEEAFDKAAEATEEAFDKAAEKVAESMKDVAKESGEAFAEAIKEAVKESAEELTELAEAAEKATEKLREARREREDGKKHGRDRSRRHHAAEPAAEGAAPRAEAAAEVPAAAKEAGPPLGATLRTSFGQALRGAGELGRSFGKLFGVGVKNEMVDDGGKILGAFTHSFRDRIHDLAAPWRVVKQAGADAWHVIAGAASSTAERAGGAIVRGLGGAWRAVASAASGAARAAASGLAERVTGAARAAAAGVKRLFTGDIGGALLGMAGRAQSFLQDFAKESVQAAMKSQAAWRRLESAVSGHGGNFSRASRELHEAADEFARKTTFSADEYATGLTAMIGATGNYSKSVSLMGLAADVAAKRQIDLKEASELVGRAANGSTDALGELGIHTKNAAQGMQQLRNETKGYAEGEATTFAGKLKQLGNLWEDLQVALGNALIASANGTSIMGELKQMVIDLTEWVGRNAGQIAHWGAVVLEVAKASVITLWDVVKVLFSFGEVIGNFIQYAFFAVETLVDSAVSKAHHAFNDIADWIEKVTGVHVAHASLDVDVDLAHARDQMHEFAGAMHENLGTIGSAFADIGHRWSAVAGAIARPPAIAQPTPPPADHSRPETEGESGGRSGAERGARAAEPAQPAQPAEDPEEARRRALEEEIGLLAQAKELNRLTNDERQRAYDIEVDLTAQRDKAAKAGNLREELRLQQLINQIHPVAEKTDAKPDANTPAKAEADRLRQLKKVQFGAKDLLGAIHEGAMKAADGMSDAFTNSFEMIFSGMGNLHSAFTAMWKGMGQAVANGIADEAKGHSKKETAAAVSATAEAIGMAARLDPKAGGMFLSAAEHLAAAAAWSALAGGAGAASNALGGKGGGGGGSSSPSSSRDAGSGVAQNAKKAGPQIHIYVDGMDPRNPRHQQLTQETLKGVAERYGQTGSVTYHPAGAR